jgi:hypothetical protein
LSWFCWFFFVEFFADGRRDRIQKLAGGTFSYRCKHIFLSWVLINFAFTSPKKRSQKAQSLSYCSRGQNLMASCRSTIFAQELEHAYSVEIPAYFPGELSEGLHNQMLIKDNRDENWIVVIVSSNGL